MTVRELLTLANDGDKDAIERVKYLVLNQDIELQDYLESAIGLKKVSK